MPMHTRPIPSTGERLPVVGLGTYRSFDVGPRGRAYEALPRVVDALLAAGGAVIDTSPMYGRAEQTIGEVLPRATVTAAPFLATKVWTEGRDAGVAQMTRSLAWLGVDRVDLMQVHNLVDWRTHTRTLRRWKDEGRVRYLGITHYTASAYAEVERVMRSESYDFLQINYSLEERDAEARLLPLAAERGMAVLVNRPLGQGSLLPRLTGRALPPWAAEVGVSSWATLAIAFAVSHPAITCAIPATGNPAHLTMNAAAGRLTPLTERQRRDLIAVL
jgi:aryl-alcohol dehydrogenase-like predicted oxidoreductase